MRRMPRCRGGLAALLLLLAAGARPAGAQTTIVGGSSLLNQARADQLAAWLGEGNLTLTRIYAKSAGHVSQTFHAGVDGQGRTFTVLEATGAQGTNLIGGYNPQSWDSDGHYHITIPDAERTAFLFNLTTSVKQNQRLSSELTGETDNGKYQTWNQATWGPIFGGGHDVVVLNDMAGAQVKPFSYGPTVAGVHQNILGTTAEESLSVGGLEVFTIGPGSGPQVVPEPGSISLFLTGLAGVLPRKRRKKR